MTLAKAILRIDNERVLVTEWSFEPGAETGHHVHTMDYLVIPLNDGTLRIGDTETALQTGVAYARPAGVAHNVVNAGHQSLRFIEVELKSPASPPSPQGVPS